MYLDFILILALVLVVSPVRAEDWYTGALEDERAVAVQPLAASATDANLAHVGEGDLQLQLISASAAA